MLSADAKVMSTLLGERRPLVVRPDHRERAFFVGLEHEVTTGSLLIPEVHSKRAISWPAYVTTTSLMNHAEIGWPSAVRKNPVSIGCEMIEFTVIASPLVM